MNRYENKNSYVEFKDGLRVQFFDFNGKKESELNADYAIIDNENDIMSAKKCSSKKFRWRFIRN